MSILNINSSLQTDNGRCLWAQEPVGLKFLFIFLSHFQSGKNIREGREMGEFITNK